MKLTEKVIIPAQVMARTVGEETVVLDLVSGTYYGLNPVGTRIWVLMGEGKTLEEIRDTLLDEYDVSREDLENDLIDLVEELFARKLISV